MGLEAGVSNGGVIGLCAGDDGRWAPTVSWLGDGFQI